jgi:hypothetical protein
MCLGPDAKGEFGVGRRAIRRESGASGGTGGARMGAGARLRSLPAFRGARRRRSIVERVLEVFREPEKGGYRRCSSLELGSRVTPEAWPALELDAASFFPEIG